MLGFPQTTEFNKRIPKQKFYESMEVSPVLKRAFKERICLIHWRNKLAATTMNIAPGETVTEIEVIEIQVAQPRFDEAALKQIDKEIPYHILFVLSFDGKAQVWIGHKEATEGSNRAYKINKYYHTDWMPQDEQKEKLIKEIAKLEKQARNEKQPNKKFQLAQQARGLKKQLAELG